MVCDATFTAESGVIEQADLGDAGVVERVPAILPLDLEGHVLGGMELLEPDRLRLESILE